MKIYDPVTEFDKALLAVEKLSAKLKESREKEATKCGASCSVKSDTEAKPESK